LAEKYDVWVPDLTRKYDSPRHRCKECSRYQGNIFGKQPSAKTIKETVIDNPDNAQEMETLLSMLKRRPCSLEDVCASLGMARNHAVKYITILQQNGQIEPQNREGTIYYKAT